MAQNNAQAHTASSASVSAAYRMSPIEPLAKSEVLSSFDDALRTPCPVEDSVWACVDGSEIRFLPSEDKTRFYVEFRVRFHALAVNRGVSFGILPRVLALCQKHGGDVKVRGGSVLPATGGIMSDVFHSEAYRLARHRAEHPTDAKDVT